MRIYGLAIFALFIAVTPASAWEGYDYERGTFVEIDDGNRVRAGELIEVYEYGEGYKTFDVDSVRRYGSSVEVNVIDTETGESRTFEMDD